MPEGEKSKPYLSLVLALLTGTATGALITGISNHRLETRKFELATIQAAIAQDDKGKRIEGLQFLIDINLIRDENLSNNLRRYIDSKNVPQLAPVGPTSSPTSTLQIELPKKPVQWGVLFGGYKNIDQAIQIRDRAVTNGFSGTIVYKNGPLFELATPYKDLPTAQQALEQLKEAKLSESPIVINIQRWCPNPIQRGEYIEGDPEQNKYLNP